MLIWSFVIEMPAQINRGRGYAMEVSCGLRVAELILNVVHGTKHI